MEEIKDTPPKRVYKKKKGRRGPRQKKGVEIKTKKFHGIFKEENKLKRQELKKKMFIGGGIVFSVLLIVYIGFSVYFMNHFFFGTQINGVDFSAKTVKTVEEYMKEEVGNYALKLSEINDGKEVIQGFDIDMVYKPTKNVKKALDKQNAFLWPIAFFSRENKDITIEVEYNKEKLNAVIANLECMKEENQIPSASAMPTFDGNAFVITPEVVGTQINQEVFGSKVHEYVGQFHEELNMTEEDCYLIPKFMADAPEVAAARDAMNGYLVANITYNMNPNKEVVDKTQISTWVKVDENMEVVFDTAAVAAYVDGLCSTYNTVGKTKAITTPTGKVANVSGGEYGWKIARDDEVAALIANIQAGETIEREPVYAQKAVVHGENEWGNTYVEVDLSAQYMWFISNGSVVFQTAVITGLPNDGRETPQGVNPILEKKRNKTLRGDKREDGTYEYETPVEYWMRVTWTGIGFHDATWQPSFGGELYKTKGSHGCINMSFNDAATLYDAISVGTPVIIHY